MNQLDLFGARRERDRGTQQTLGIEEEDWLEVALKLLGAFARRHPDGFVAESFRECWSNELDLPLPHTHKVWGALFLIAARRGVIVNTGVYRQAKSRKTHAHPVPVWKSTS